MTGRDLIIYILKNNLEDKPVYENGQLLGFMTVEQAAVKLGWGVETVRTWIKINYIAHIKIGDEIFIPMDIEM